MIFFLFRYKPLRRRVIWLIGQWISVKFKSDLRPMLYEAICNLLQDQDLVVCFLSALKELVFKVSPVQIIKFTTVYVFLYNVYDLLPHQLFVGEQFDLRVENPLIIVCPSHYQSLKKKLSSTVIIYNFLVRKKKAV